MTDHKADILAAADTDTPQDPRVEAVLAFDSEDIRWASGWKWVVDALAAADAADREAGWVRVRLDDDLGGSLRRAANQPMPYNAIERVLRDAAQPPVPTEETPCVVAVDGYTCSVTDPAHRRYAHSGKPPLFQRPEETR